MATKYTHRFLARLIIEAKTPLAVGSGEKDIMTDALVARDVNGLPYIPGTAIAGVLRHMINALNPQRNNFGQTMADIIFGYQETEEQKKERTKNTQKDLNEDYSKGSEIIFSDAKILNSKSEVIDGLNINAFDDDLLMHYQTLPIRQHVRINAKGSAYDKGKFDNQVCYAGTRFCFEIEMVAENETTDLFNNVLNSLKNKTFRIGSGTRNGLGDIEVADLQTKTLDLVNGGLEEYLKKSSNLNSDFWKKDSKNPSAKNILPQNYEEIKFNIKAKDFFLFGSGFGDTEADITPVSEAKVDWTSGVGTFVENLVLIPAASLKGALSHRVAYHWNRLNKIFIGDSNKVYTQVAGTKIINPAVKVLFGYEDQKKKIQKRGNLIFSDIIKYKLDKETTENTQVHVAIDRFTGGAKVKSGALFTEKNVYGEGMDFTVNILKDNDNIKKYIKEVFKTLPDTIKTNGEDKFLETVNKAFDAAIADLKKGMLPLGGGTSRGNGIFVES